MIASDVVRLVLSLVTRAVIILPFHIALILILPKMRGKVGAKQLKLLWLVAAVPMALFLLPDLFSTTVKNGAMSYAAAFGAKLGNEVIAASNSAIPEICGIVSTGLAHVWVTGAVVVAGRRIVDLIALRVIVERRTVWRKKRGRITMRYVDGGITSPVTYGLISPEVVIPIEAAEDEVLCRMLTMHELTHIENRDVLVRCAMTFFCAVYWFYPPIFFIERELCVLSELACDAEAIGLVPSRATDYGRMLVEYSRRKINVSQGLENRLSEGGRNLLVRIESIIEPCAVTRKMKRVGTLMLAAVITLSICFSAFQTMACGKRELTLFEATIDVPGYLGVVRESDSAVIFTLGGSAVGMLLRLRSTIDFDAFYSFLDSTSIYQPNPNGQLDGNYLRGVFTRRGEKGSFFLFSDQRLGTRDTYALCLYETPMMGLFSAVDMAKSVKQIRNSEFGVRNYGAVDKFSLAADLEHFLSQ